jgi:hypothetical protein
MRTSTTVRRLPMLTAGILLLAACSDGGDPTDPIELGSSEPGVAEEQPTDEPDGGTLGAGAEDDAAGDATEPDAATDEPRSDGNTPGLVDLTEAIPGTWPVGDAGTVTFAIVDGALVLEDVAAADGWRADIDEQDPDEIEVDFRRGDVEWEIEIELENGGTILEIEIDQDIERAEPGSYDLGDAGTFAFSVSDGRLVLDDLNIADGWTLTELDEEAHEIEFELVNGPREFDVEIELEEDGSIEIEIDYEVVGPVTN